MSCEMTVLDCCTNNADSCKENLPHPLNILTGYTLATSSPSKASSFPPTKTIGYFNNKQSACNFSIGNFLVAKEAPITNAIYPVRCETGNASCDNFILEGTK